MNTNLNCQFYYSTTCFQSIYTAIVRDVDILFILCVLLLTDFLI